MTSMALVRNGPCLPTGAVCSARFAYDWDELGRMVRARRWDTATPGVASDPLPSGTPDVDLRHVYDASDQRVVKTAVDASANERHTVYVFGSLELRGAVFESGDYADTKATEVVYLFAHGVRVARLHYSEDSLPTLTSGKLHVLLELPDHLGSSSIVIDKETGELAERTTYLAYGGTESDYRPDRWGSFREDYKFTGKEEDEEVGLQYFGKRFFAPGLGRWISPDPLAVHDPLSESERLADGPTSEMNQSSPPVDLNLYAYVASRVFISTDPTGLQATRYAPPVRPGNIPQVAPPPPVCEALDPETIRRLRVYNTSVPAEWAPGSNRPTSRPTLLRLRTMTPIVVQGPSAPPGGYVILPHGLQERNGNESHHGVPSVVAGRAFKPYGEDAAPTILVSTAEHDLMTLEQYRINRLFKEAGYRGGWREAMDSLKTPQEKLDFAIAFGRAVWKAGGPMDSARTEAWAKYEAEFVKYAAEREAKARVEAFERARAQYEIEHGPQIIETPKQEEE